MAVNKFEIDGTYLTLKNGLEVKVNSTINRFNELSILTYVVKNVTVTYDRIYKKYKFTISKFQSRMVTEDFKNLRIKKITYKKLLKTCKLKRKETSYEHS